MQFLDSLSLLLLLLFAPFHALAHPVPIENESEKEMGPLVRYDAPGKATASVILLHGIGNSSDVFRPIPPRYHSQERFQHINFIFPNAPIRNTPFWHNWQGGDPNTRSWFNTSAAGMDDWFDETQYWEVVDYIQQLVLNETAHGIAPERIIAGGFSQGGMESYGALSTIKPKIGGWLFFSSMIPENLTQFSRRLNFDNKQTPVFDGHGTNDSAIPIAQSYRTASLFTKLKFNYHLHVYPGMGHQTDWEPNDRDVEEWIAKTIPRKWGEVVVNLGVRYCAAHYLSDRTTIVFNSSDFNVIHVLIVCK